MATDLDQHWLSGRIRGLSGTAIARQRRDEDHASIARTCWVDEFTDQRERTRCVNGNLDAQRRGPNGEAHGDSRSAVHDPAEDKLIRQQDCIVARYGAEEPNLGGDLHVGHPCGTAPNRRRQER